MLKPEDQRYQDIVSLWNDGRGYDEISFTLKVSNQTINRVRKDADLPARPRGPHTPAAATPTPGMVADQGGCCGACGQKSRTFIYVPGPTSSTAIFAACKRCHDIYSLISWNAEIIQRLWDYWNTHKPDGDAAWIAEQELRDAETLKEI